MGPEEAIAWLALAALVVALLVGVGVEFIRKGENDGAE